MSLGRPTATRPLAGHIGGGIGAAPGQTAARALALGAAAAGLVALTAWFALALGPPDTPAFEPPLLQLLVLGLVGLLPLALVPGAVDLARQWNALVATLATGALLLTGAVLLWGWLGFFWVLLVVPPCTLGLGTYGVVRAVRRPGDGIAALTLVVLAVRLVSLGFLPPSDMGLRVRMGLAQDELRPRAEVLIGEAREHPLNAAPNVARLGDRYAVAFVWSNGLAVTGAPGVAYDPDGILLSEPGRPSQAEFGRHPERVGVEGGGSISAWGRDFRCEHLDGPWDHCSFG